jgi:hypothetical protein
MAEPGSEPSEISLRAAEVAADVSEAERPQDRRRLVEAFTRAARSGARVAGRGTRAARGGVRKARGGARWGTSWLAAQVTAMAPRLRVRDQAALREQFGGKSAEDIADALVEGAARAAATAGGVAGVWAVLPALPAFPAEVAAETLVLVGIEIKLVAELHEAYGMPAEGNVAERMSAYVASWAHRRGVFMIPGGVVLVAGSPLARLLRRRLAARAGRSAFSLAPLLTGAVIGAFLNGRETRRLGQDIRRDLRRRVLTSSGEPALGPADDVLQPHLAVSDEPARLVGDIDAPQLLGAALAERGRLDVHPPAGHRTQEVRGVGQPDGDLTLIAHGGAGADARRALDRGRVDAAVDDAPRGVVIGAKEHVPGDAGRGNLVKDQACRAHEGAGVIQGSGVQARRGPDRASAGLSAHRRSHPGQARSLAPAGSR